ncbi:MAG: coproporphyrinogen-III oxidase family protein, partial [Parabacteroides sp.]|nr:coproporphyrinogen-III oxidase family protein [Parabacteroides sp.]
ISMGVQSFDAADLKFLNRRHDREEALRAVRLCQEHNLYNISIDLIYGLPGQTPEKWQKNLDEVLRLDIPHISAYHLIYEEGTALYRLLEAGKITAVDEETSLELFTLLIENLAAAGYQHYEISNFARPGWYARHNSSYWKGKKYLGLGPSAHSYNGTEREWNVASLPEWIKGIQTGKPALENEQLDENTCYNEYIMTHLRTMWGIDLNELSEKFGEKKLKYCLNIAQTYEKRNLLLQKDGKLTLTKEGIFVSDGIMSDLLWV